MNSVKYLKFDLHLLGHSPTKLGLTHQGAVPEYPSTTDMAPLKQRSETNTEISRSTERNTT